MGCYGVTGVSGYVRALSHNRGESRSPAISPTLSAVLSRDAVKLRV